MKRTTPLRDFLSWVITSSRRCGGRPVYVVGNPSASSSAHRRERTAALHKPRRSDRIATSAMPTATASPCEYCVYIVAASNACPQRMAKIQNGTHTPFGGILLHHA